ncbi:sigma factor-like helix-turn-helix DNA-binding protein [Kribbella yunnanensis]|uniref:sigma factor-like helix-turn-helix DNA-binding protein n=1 Tax=Kribbella yunnanensis TaxID=190194 RepID=UPI0031D90E95
MGALRRISSAHRESVTRVHLLDRPVEEVAEAIGIPIGTVRSRTHHGIRALRSALSDHDAETPHEACG